MNNIATIEQKHKTIPPTEFNPNALRCWQAKTAALASWTRYWLCNRLDTFGKYYNCGTPEVGNCREKRKLKPEDVESHYLGRTDRVGVYSYNQKGYGKWACIDIDAHNGEVLANWHIASKMIDQLLSWGIVPLVEHTNGKYGFHLWIMFDSWVECRKLHSIGNYLVGEMEHEVFPKQASPTDYGNYVRLPGRHHKHLGWWSDFYDPVLDVWHRDADAVDYLLGFKGGKIKNIPTEALSFVPTPSSKAKTINGPSEGVASDWSRYKGSLATLDILKLSADRLTGNSSGNAYDVVCPWQHEHTTDSGGTCVFVNENSWPAFKCLHAHCQDRHLADYLACYPDSEVDACCSENFGAEPIPDVEVPSWDQDAFAKAEPEDLSGLYDGLEMMRRALASKSCFLFQNILESGVISLITGAPYSGKSLIVLQLTVDLILKRAFYEHACLSEPLPVLYINADRMRDTQFNKRLATICGDDALLLSVLPYFYFTELADLPNTITADYLRSKTRAIKAKHKCDAMIVVIDTLRPAFLLEQQSGAENDSGVMSKMLTPVRQVANEENLAVMLLHHNNRSRDDFAGSAAIAGVTEAVWNVKKEGNHSTITIDNRETGRFKITASLGQKDAAETQQDPLADFIEAFPESIEDAWTVDDALEHFPDIGRTTLQIKISEAERPGIYPRLERTGTGKKGCPFRYYCV